jgi:NAD(P)-dependent dehydrogenase (short-subunit alcohol dehydrogenase family)
VEKLFQDVLKQHHRIDAVANCVGNVVAKSLLATGASDLDSILKENLHSSFNILKSSVKAMLAEGSAAAKGPSEVVTDEKPLAGAVVLVSAAVASHGVANYEAMSAAKAGVEGEWCSAWGAWVVLAG